MKNHIIAVRLWKSNSLWNRFYLKQPADQRCSELRFSALISIHILHVLWDKNYQRWKLWNLWNSCLALICSLSVIWTGLSCGFLPKSSVESQVFSIICSCFFFIWVTRLKLLAFSCKSVTHMNSSWSCLTKSDDFCIDKNEIQAKSKSIFWEFLQFS